MIPKPPLKTVLIGLILGLVLGLLPVAPPTAFADETVTEPPKVELVLDVSGSMRAEDVGGRSRIAVAQQAFNDVVDALPSQTQLGIRVLGATYPGQDKTVACRDTQLLVPVSGIDKARAKDAIATLRPTGYTPIGLALRAAAGDLGTGTTTRRVVLITDGEDTCAPPDPCEVARELAAQGTHLVVDTLGLIPDEKVRRQLVCIASATGGSYYAATSADGLTNRIRQLVDRAKDTYTRTPAVVAGARDCASAPVLTKGVYTDREQFSEHRWYRIPIHQGQELRASASVTIDRPVRRDFGVLLQAVTTDGRELVRGTDAGSGRTDVISAGIRWSATEHPLPRSWIRLGQGDTPSGTPTPTGSGAPAGADADSPDAPTSICVVISNSLAPAGSADTATGVPVELVVDVVDASPTPDGPGLGRGWTLLALLAAVGLLTGILAGWLLRAWIAFRGVA